MSQIFFLPLFIIELLLLFFLSRFLTNSLSQVFFRLTKNQSFTINLMAFLFLPGVIVHELSHLFIAMLLFVRVGEIEFMPQIREDGVKMGSVGIGKTDPIRRAIIGFAPVIVGVSILVAGLLSYSDVFFKLEFSLIALLRILAVLYIIFAIANTMFSSKKDVEGTLGLLAVVLLFIVLFYFAGIRIPPAWVSYLVSERFITVAKNADLILAIPIFIDVLVVGATKKVLKR